MGCGGSTSKEASLDGVMPEQGKPAEASEPVTTVDVAPEVQVEAMQAGHPHEVPREDDGSGPLLAAGDAAERADAQVDGSGPLVNPQVWDSISAREGEAQVHAEGESSCLEAREVAQQAVSECLQKAELAAEGYRKQVEMEEVQCVAAQHVESWTASVLVLQNALAEAGMSTERPRRPSIPEAEEVLYASDACGQESAGWSIDKSLEKERPGTAEGNDGSTCAGSRRDQESRCDLWEGSEIGRPASSEWTGHLHTPIKSLEEEFDSKAESGSLLEERLKALRDAKLAEASVADAMESVARAHAARIEADALGALGAERTLHEATRMRIDAEAIQAEIERSLPRSCEPECEVDEVAGDANWQAHLEAQRQSDAEHREAVEALEASCSAAWQIEMQAAEAEEREKAARELRERERREAAEALARRQRALQEEAAAQAELDRREALRALDVTRQVQRNCDADAKAKWEQMKANAVAAEREVKQAVEERNMRIEKQAEQERADAEAPPPPPPPPEEPQTAWRLAAKDELERVQAEADNLLAQAQRAQVLAAEEQQRAMKMQSEADRAEARARAAQMEALKCREKLRRTEKEADDEERRRCEAVLEQIRWRVEARRLVVEEELFSQATLDSERPEQMDGLGAFPPVVNHAKANLEHALRTVRCKMERHGMTKLPVVTERVKEVVVKPETFDDMLQRMRGTWDARLKVLEGQGWTPGSPRP